MRRQLTRTIPVALIATLALSACGGQERATFEEADAPQAQPADAPDDGDGVAPDDAEDTAGTGDPAGTDSSARTEGGPRTSTEIPPLVPIEWADAPRDLTAVEQQFLIEPGPFAGDAYDEDAVLEAVLAMNPTTVEEWQQAIQSQVQGDYAADLQAAITFDPDLGEAIDDPSEDAPAGQEAAVGTNHFALVLDASGSMGEQSDTGTRMEEAKEAINDFVETLPEGATVSLRVYGHEGDNTHAGKDASCAATESFYTGPADDSDFADALDSVEPTGWTPLATAITEAEGDIPPDATDGIVYVVTDGIETCDGDPVAAAETLAGSGIQPIVNVIGFQAGDADQEALAAIADAGGGEYTQADTKADLTDYWDEEYSRMMAAWDEWKSAELARIEDEGQANMSEAEEVGQRLMTGAEEEGQRAMDLADRLAEIESVDYPTRSAVWSHFYGRKGEMWSYAYGVKNENWSAAYGIKNEAWSDAYGKGTEKWSEYYGKSLGN